MPAIWRAILKVAEHMLAGESAHKASQIAGDSIHDRARPARDEGPAKAARAQSKPRKRTAKQFWLKQLHSWHWISAAISLAGMFVFSVTGITLNHAATIGAEPKVVNGSGTLAPSLLGLLARVPDGDAIAIPDQVVDEVHSLVGIDAGGVPAEWSEAEVYVAVPGPGSDAWVSINRTSGAITSERTDRGWVSFFNDLHKGRNTGTAWFWLIDVLAVACVIFSFTGMLLLQLHAKHRPSTWPLVGLGLAVPTAIILFFMHF